MTGTEALDKVIAILDRDYAYWQSRITDDEAYGARQETQRIKTEVLKIKSEMTGEK